MKKIIFLFIYFSVLTACTNVDEEIALSREAQSSMHAEDEAIVLLTADIGLLAQTYQMAQPTTRSWKKFFASICKIFYIDACGYVWGRQQSFPWQLSLGCGAVASIVSAISSNEVNITPVNACVEYATPTFYEKIGQSHNEAIQRVTILKPLQVINANKQFVKEVNSIAIDASSYFANSTTTTNTRTDITTNNPISVEEESIEKELSFTQIMAQQKDLDRAHEKAKLLLNDKSTGYDLDFLKEYVINISEIDNKDLIRKFTIEINKSIDKAKLSSERSQDLKTMIAIAENSYSLWEITEK